MKEFDLSQANLASASINKRGIVEGSGGIVIGEKRVTKRVYYAEEEFYRGLAETYGLEDGLLSPFWVKYGQIEAPLPVLVTNAKLNGVQALLEEDESLKSLGRIDVSDTVWVLEDENGESYEAINRARPKNGEDIERLADFLSFRRKRKLRSTGAWGRLDTNTSETEMVSASIIVGDLKDQEQSAIADILFESAHDHGIFDLSFVVDKLVEKPEYYILSEDIVELTARNYSERNLTYRKLKSKEASRYLLQVAAHGFHLPEE